MENKQVMIHVVYHQPDMKVTGLEHCTSRAQLWHCLAVTLLFLLTPLLLYAEINPGDPYGDGGTLDEQQSLSVPLNKSIVIKLPEPVGRVSVANPELVDLLVINSREIYLVGKRLGTTNAILWDRAKRVQEIIGLQVTHDLDGLKQKLHQFLPDENIQVASSQESIVLSGEVSSPQKMSAALDLAKTYLMNKKQQSGKGGKASQLLNLLQIGGAQQVLLEVKVAEISRSLVRRLDINFSAFSTDSHWSLGAVNGGAAFPDALISDPVLGEVRVPHLTGDVWGPAVSELAPSQSTIENTGLFMQYLSGDFFLEFVIDAAKNKGLAKVLAEPNLTTLSGQEAKFISGGEFPIPVPQSNGNVTVKFKEYGVGLIFVPVVLDSGLVSLKVNVSVSELATDNALRLGFSEGLSSSNYFIPALTKRAANATVEVPSGQTIAIAGLINENLRESVRKFPGLGDLPILGNLFRSQEFIKGQSELVIFVTPRLAKAFDSDLAKLPTDDFVEPNDTEFYLLGRMEGRLPSLGPDKTGAEDFFGHEL